MIRNTDMNPPQTWYARFVKGTVETLVPINMFSDGLPDQEYMDALVADARYGVFTGIVDPDQSEDEEAVESLTERIRIL